MGQIMLVLFVFSFLFHPLCSFSFLSSFFIFSFVFISSNNHQTSSFSIFPLFLFSGKDVYNKDPNFSDIMESAARTLNVKKHVCGRSRPVELAAAADIEGHRGTDGKYYLLDFSRTMPPVKPDTTRFQNPHLYNLFRKEFVSKFRKPLCSDAYSGFILKDELMMEHNREIDEATHYLLSLLVPELAVEV